MTGANVILELVPLGGEKISSHAHKTGPWYLLGVLFKISVEHPRPFYKGVLLSGTGVSSPNLRELLGGRNVLYTSMQHVLESIRQAVFNQRIRRKSNIIEERTS